MALQNLRSNTANKRPTASGMVDGQVAINTNATNPGLFFKDAGDGIRKVGPVFIGSSAPNSSPAAGGSSGHSIGEQWLDTSGSRYVLKTWDGGAWRDDDSNYLQLTGGALSGALTIDNAANVAALDLKFDGDTNTGFYSPSADTLGFVTGGLERARISTHGRLGIGTTSPARELSIGDGTGSPNIQLLASSSGNSRIEFGDTADSDAGEIQYVHSSNYMQFTTNGSESLRIDSSGRLLLGTSSSFESATGALLQIKPASNVTPVISLMRNDSSITDGNNLGQIAFYSNDGNTPVKTAQIVGQSSQEHTSTARGTDIVFSTTEASTADAPTERLRIDSSGRVGIGTSSPSNALHVEKNNSSADLVYLNNTGVSASDVLRLNTAGTGSGTNIFDAQSGGTSRFLIRGDGNVGIGTTSPSNTLHVSGAGTIARLQSSSSTAALRFENSGANDGYVKYISQDLTFTTADNERMRINSSGKVLIGTTTVLESGTPAKLQMTHTSGALLAIGRNDNAVSDGNDMGKIAFYGNDSGAYEKCAEIRCEAHGSHGTGDKPGRLVFATTANDANTPVDHMVIDRDGNVGIGTSSPNRKLQVAGSTAITNSGDTGAFLFDPAGSVNTLLSRAGQSSTTALPLAVKIGNTERLRLDSSGRLLLGSTSAIVSGALDNSLHLKSPNGPEIYFLRDDSGSTVAGNAMGMLRFYGNDNDGTAQECARIECEADLDHGNNDKPSRLLFLTTADGASSPTERMRISSNGNCSIGTTLSSNKLRVHEGSDTPNVVVVTGADESTEFLALGVNSGVPCVTAGGVTSTSASLAFRTADNGTESERMRITSQGKLLVGTTSSRSVRGVEAPIQVEGATAHESSISLTRNVNSGAQPYLLFAKTRGTSNGSNTIVQNNDPLGTIEFAGADGTDTNSRAGLITCEVDGTPGSNDMPGRLLFSTTADGGVTPTERMRIDSSGVVKVTGSNEQSMFHLSTGNTAGNTFAGMRGDNEAGVRIVGGGSFPGGGIEFGGGLRNSNPGIIRFYSGTASSVEQRMTLNNSGDFFVAKTSDSSTAVGHSLNASGLARHVRSGGTVMAISRGSSDGTLVVFQRAGTSKGTISVSGNTVTYGAFCGTHWGRLGDSSKPEILPGTILETINQAVEWKVIEFTVDGEQKRQAYNGSEQNGTSVTVEYEGVSYTGTVADEEPDSEDLNKHVCVKVSDTSASKAVFGVFLGWDDQEDQEANNGVLGAWNDMNIAALGNYFIRIKSGQSLEIGDLIESDGTGCGVVQSDDIIRSKTVGKVTSTTPQQTYADGSFLVTCVLYSG